MAQGETPKINCIDLRRAIKGIARRCRWNFVSALITVGLRDRHDGRPSDWFALGRNASWQHECRFRGDVN